MLVLAPLRCPVETGGSSFVLLQKSKRPHCSTCTERIAWGRPWLRQGPTPYLLPITQKKPRCGLRERFFLSRLFSQKIPDSFAGKPKRSMKILLPAKARPGCRPDRMFHKVGDRSLMAEVVAIQGVSCWQCLQASLDIPPSPGKRSLEPPPMSKRAEQKTAPDCILTIHIAAIVLLLIDYVINYSGGPDIPDHSICTTLNSVKVWTVCLSAAMTTGALAAYKLMQRAANRT